MRANLYAKAILALFSAVPAATQDHNDHAGKPDDIVVVGRNDRDRDDQVRDFVRGMTPTPGTDPIARFDTEQLCPQAVGLAEKYNNAITDRMRQVAAAAKINVAPVSCRYPNALVMFVDKKAAMIALLKKRYPGLFRDAQGDPFVVGKEEGPVTAWHVGGMVTRDGIPIQPRGTVRTSGVASRLQAMARPVYLMSVVLIERRGVNGLTATQIADYAAMRAFTDATPARLQDTRTSTILTVIDAPMGSATPLSMTAWDLSFMQGLYASPRNSHSSAQRGAIGSYMKHELDKRNGRGD